MQPSEQSTSKDKSSIDPNWNRAALMKLKESIDHKSIGSANGSISALAFNQNMQRSVERSQMSNERPRRQTINLAKLSMVLKNQGNMNVPASASRVNDNSALGGPSMA